MHLKRQSNVFRRFALLGPLLQMASRKKKLGKYVEGRCTKYRHPYRILFHTSISPRRVLHPKITPCQHEGDPDRPQPLVFLCPFQDIRTWVEWVFQKHGPSKQEVLQRQVLMKGAPVILYVHLVRVVSRDLQVPKIRYGQEFVVKKAVCPVAIVPVRYYLGRSLNLAKVSACMQKIKETTHRKR
ncbi:MAG: hypothetical protein RBG13Loki_0572 [Promethearchaeota archaeon CR_4]|nr:MAG: hypothetical protein RBG13Loki_0572 [Candidatus Lokiarchaeota archaeon CR_4]